MMGMKYMLSGGGDKVKKAHLVETGGTFFMVVGLVALVAFSWIGHGVVPDFYNPLIPMNVKDEFGPAIYIGWVFSGHSGRSAAPLLLTWH